MPYRDHAAPMLGFTEHGTASVRRNGPKSFTLILSGHRGPNSSEEIPGFRSHKAAANEAKTYAPSNS